MTVRRFSSGTPKLWASTMLASFLSASACSSEQNAGQLAKTFVAEFYNSYITLQGSRPRSEPVAWVIVAHDPDSVLTSDLAAALVTDREEDLETDGIDGLSWDPFFGGQDFCDTYRVERIVTLPAGLRAEVYGDCGEQGVPHVIAEVVLVHGGYRFSNFYYPSVGTDLVIQLARLRDARR